MTKSLVDIVGSENFFDDVEVLDRWSKDYSFVTQRRPVAVVKVKDSDAVQRVVKWANDTKTPLVPVSSGQPHFRGDTVPSAGGAVIVDLSEMKKIIRVDRRNRYALIEPGVTYSELQKELAGFEMKVPMPLLPKSSKSVLASLLEREPVLMPNIQWVLLDPLGCVDIIWGCGEEYVSGEAGANVNPGALAEQWARNLDQIFPYGPGMWDAYRIVSGAQGTMGIVRWASVRCELIPRKYCLYFITSERLDVLLKFMARYLRFRYGDETLLLNCWNMASILGRDAKEIAELAKNMPKWTLILTLAGYDILPEERVEYQNEDVNNLAQQYGLKLQSKLSDVDGSQMYGILNRPSGDPYWKTKYKGSCQEIFFLTTVDKIPAFETIMCSVAEESGYPTVEIGGYIQPQQHGVAYHVEFDLPYDPNNLAEAERVKNILVKASDKLLRHGAYFSRPYGVWSSMVYGSDYINTYVLKELKKIFDPNNVMNPGKLCF